MPNAGHYDNYSDDSGFYDGDSSPSHTSRRDNINPGGRNRQDHNRRGRQPPNDRYPGDGSSSEGYWSSTSQTDKIKRLETLVHELLLTQEDNEDNKRRIKSLEEKNGGLKDRIRFLDEQRVILGGKVDTLGVEKRSLKGQIRSLREENKDREHYRRRVVHLQTELERREQLVESTQKKLHDEKLAAAKSKTVYKTNIKAVQRERDNAYNISEENRVTLERTMENLAAERRRSALLQMTNQNLQVEITNLNFQLREIGGENQNLRRHNHHLTQQLEGTRRNLEEKEKALENINRARRGNTIVQQGANGKPEFFRPRPHH